MKRLVGGVVGLALVAIGTGASADKAADCLAGGRKLDAKGRHAEAIAAWTGCLVTTPEDATLEGEIAAAAFQMHDLNVAQQFARAAISHAHATADPSLEAAALFTLGRTQEARKDVTAAIASYTTSLALRANPVVRARLVALDPKAPIPTVAVVPPAFKTIVDDQKAELGMRLVDWWQDDLDGDGKAENIAALCEDEGERGVFLIAHQGNLLVAVRHNAGRDACPKVAPPSWHVEHRGFIDHGYSVHRGSVTTAIAVRGHHAVRIRDSYDGADGTTDLDWDKLTTSDDRETPPLVAIRIVVITDSEPRWTSISKGLTLAATIDGDKVVLHVRSAAQVQVSFCSGDDQACTKAIAKPVKGFRNLTVPDPDAKTSGSQTKVKLEVSGVASQVMLVRAEGELIGGYPSASP
jgi:hypothetical protein